MDVSAVANEVLTLFSTLRDICQSVTQRVDNFRDNRQHLSQLKDELSNAEQKINLCTEMLKRYCEAISTELLQFEVIVMHGMIQTLQRVDESVKEVEETLQRRRWGGFKQFRRANRIAQVISEQVQVIRDVGSRLNDMHEKLKVIGEQHDLFRPDFTSIPNVRVPVYLDFSARDTMEGEVKATLLESVNRSGRNVQNGHSYVTAVVGVCGMGGVGKTTALIGLAKDADVREKFSAGGIHFLVVGKDATPGKLVSGLKEIVKRSGGKKRSEEIDSNGSLESAVRTTSAWFAGRRALFICDDLWQTSSCLSGYFEKLIGLIDCSPESHIVISTRSSAIACEASSRIVFEPRVNTGRGARGIFLTSAGLDESMIVEGGCGEYVVEVLELCGGVPLMLSIAGAQVRRRKATPKKSLEALLYSLTHERLSLPERQPRQYPSCFNQAVQASLTTIPDVLESSEEFVKPWNEYSTETPIRAATVLDFVMDCFQRLCVLPRNEWVSEEVIFGIWCMTNKKLGWRVINSLVDIHVVLEYEDAAGIPKFGLHDVLLDYCEQMSRAGLNDKYEAYHREFLGHACKFGFHVSSSQSNMEDTLGGSNAGVHAFWEPDAYERSRSRWEVLLCPEKIPGISNYLLDHLFRHLKESGRLTEAVGLLSNMKWTKLRVTNGSISKMNADFSLVENALQLYFKKEPERDVYLNVCSGIMHIWDMVKRTWPVLLNNSEALPTHAYGYLFGSETRVPVAKRYLQSAEYIVTGPWLKPRNAFWRTADSSGDRNTFRTAEEIVNIGLLKGSNNIVAATTNMLFWIDIETMNTTRELVVRSEEKSVLEISAFTLCEKTGMVVLGFDTGQLQLRNGKNGEIIRTFLGGHGDRVTSVSMSGDGRIVVSGSFDETVQVWATENGTAVCEPLRGHEDVVRSVAISVNGQTAVSGSHDKTVRVWDLESGVAVGEPLLGHDMSVSCVAVSANGRIVVSGSWDWTVRVWDTMSGATIGNSFPEHSGYVMCVAVSADGKTVMSGCLDGTVQVWDVESGIQVGNPPAHSDAVINAVLSTEGRTVVYISSYNTVEVWDVERGNAVCETLPGHEDVVHSVDVSKDGRILVSGSSDSTVRVWDAGNGSAVGEPLCGHEHVVEGIAVSANGQTVVSGSADGTVRVWDVESGSASGEPFRGHEDEVFSVGISADGRTVVSGSEDKTVRLWDVECGSAIGDPLQGHDGPVECVAISDDGRTVVSGSWDNSVRVWDVESCAAVGEPLLGHNNMVKSVLISADKRTVVSGSRDWTVRVWDVESASEVCEPLVHDGGVQRVALSGDERTIISGSWDTKVRVWIRSESEHQWSCSYACSLPGSWKRIFAYWDVENSSEVKGKVYCPFGKGGSSSAMFDLVQLR